MRGLHYPFGMRSLLAASSLLAVLGIIYLTQFRGDGPPSLEPALHVEAKAKAPKTVETGALSDPLGANPLDSQADAQPGQRAALQEQNEETSSPSAIIGVVLDHDGRPIEDAAVSLASHKTWAPDVEAPDLGPLTPSQWTGYVGFQARTAADGSFRVEAPAPPADGAMLTIDAGLHREFHWSRYGGRGRGTKPPLEPGVRDIGEVRLGPTGMVYGSVRAEGGGPMEGCSVSVGPSMGTTFGQFTGTKTGPDGRFRLGHAPSGTYGIGARLDGYVRVFQEPITVELGMDTGPIDLVLAPAPTLEGTVTGASGQPIADARLYGWPKSSGGGAGGRTDEDGRFKIYLPQEEPYTLEAKHADYLTWGEIHNKEILFEPNTRDILIRMEVAAKTRIEVVDAESGDPIESFGFRILENNGSMAKRRSHTERRRPPLKDRPQGVVESTGRLGQDLYLVYAPGYRMASGDMTHDEGRDGAHVVRLDRGASVRGRVVDDGEAIAGATVEIVEIRPSFGEGPVRLEQNTLLRAKTDSAGRFEWTGLDARAHRLTVRPPGGTPVSVDTQGLSVGETHDFGDVELVAAGSIAGRVLLPAGVDPAALRIHLGDWKQHNEQVTDSQGGFRFDNVPPGSYTLGQHSRPEQIDGGGTIKVEVRSGETTEVSFDLRPMVLVDVELTLDLGDLPANDVRVVLIQEDAPRYRTIGSGPETHVAIGTTDSGGVASGSVRAMGPAKVQITLPSVGTFQHPSTRLNLTYPGPIQEVVRFELASLELGLPAGLDLPQEGQLHVELADPTSEGFPASASVPISAGSVDLTGAPLWKEDNGRLIIRGLLPGPREVTVYATAKDAPQVKTPLGPKSWRYGPERSFERGAQLTLVAGERAVLSLH